MSHFQHSLVIDANPAAVYAALTTTPGMQAWWTADCEVSDEVGGPIRLHFGNTRKAMRIEQLTPQRTVRWRCVAAHIDAAQLQRRDEWVGTELLFELSPQGAGQTRLDFSHFGLLPSLECYAMCRRGWHDFLSSLQSSLETGKGTPFALPAAIAA